MPLSPGTRLGPYEILAPLGAGGMGEVYRARDSRLGRDVAIKVLPEHLARNPDALTRFEREARAVAALSHPNILAIHDIGDEQGVHFLVTELLDGETLRGRLRQAGLPWRKAAQIAAAVADGLAAAHAKGITHRDVKPENIFVTSDGRVKILDFGLARWQPREEGSPEGETETEAGTVMGTVGYMSPEQVRGGRADASSDIFSLGCVIYEMVAGARAFSGPTPAQTMSAILEHDPVPPASAPPDVQSVIRHCLEKNPGERFQSARDLAFALRAAGSAATPATRGPARFPRRAVVAAAAAVVALAAVAGYFLLGRRSEAIDSLAVLPFANAGGADTEYLSDGISEALINSLSRLPMLRVVPRDTVFRYKGKDVDPEKIAADLKVRAVLTGRVVERAGTLLISAGLVDAAEHKQLWGEQYNRKLADIFAVQEEISREISDRLRLRLTGEEQQQMARRDTASAEAFQLYLQGRYHWNRRTKAGFQRAIGHFQQAIDKDPGYALAYAGLADCYNLLGWYGIQAPKESFPKAKAAAERALQINDRLAEAHASLALYRVLYAWDWPGAERAFQRAFELNPGYPSAAQWYANYLGAMGKLDQALSFTRRAQQSDPLSLPFSGAAGRVLYLNRQYDRAIEEMRKAIDLDPNYPLAHLLLGVAYLQKGMYREAIADIEEAVRLFEREPVALGPLAHAYAVSGDKARARKTLAEMDDLGKRRYVSAYHMAVAHLGLGDTQQAWSWLDRALAERAAWMPDWLRNDPRFDPLRSEPRFQELLKKMGLE